jgi:sec-independent protein translocase protein TatA
MLFRNFQNCREDMHGPRRSGVQGCPEANSTGIHKIPFYRLSARYLPGIHFYIFLYYICITNIYIMATLSIILGIPGYWQIILIVLVVLLLFGGKKIPELMRGIGRGTREFKKGLNTDDDDDKDEKEKK